MLVSELTAKQTIFALHFQEPLDNEKIVPRRNITILSGDASDVVRAYLERAHQDALKQKNPHKAYIKTQVLSFSIFSVFYM